MRDFNQFLTYCHIGANRRDRQRFDDSSYIDAFERVENYRNNNQTGHFEQLFYAIYDFLSLNSDLVSKISTPPFEVSDNKTVFDKWAYYLNDTSNSTSEYDITLLAEKLPASCGGTLSGGGGWSPTLKMMFPVVAKYINE